MRRLTRRAASSLWMGGAVAVAALALGLTTAGCESSTEDGIEGSTCVSNDEFFAVLYFQTIRTKCATCHSGGEGMVSQLKLAPVSQAGFLDTNYQAFQSVAGYEVNGVSELLLKPLGQLEHGGGNIFPDGEADPEYQQLVKLVERMKGSDSCPNTEAQFLAGTQLAGPNQVLRKSALALAARIPTDEEEAAVEAGGWDAVDAILDTYMQEQAFYTRLKEKYNDVTLVDFYMNDDFDVIGNDENYAPRWFDDISTNDAALLKKYGATSPEDLQDKLSRWTQRGVAEASLELIAYTVKNDLSFQNVVTAPYMVVNPFSAKAFKITDVTFQNDADPNEFVPAKIGGYDGKYPHAGNLSDSIWLQRHPTTATNRNRHRAKELLYVYLGNDILKAAERPIAVDASALADNPTVNNPNCSICHLVVDPIAGGFRNFQPTFDNGDDNNFTYHAEVSWFPEMYQTGFGNLTMPPTSYDKGTVWLGQQVANDPGFAFAAVFMGYRMLTGNEPLQPPAEGSDNFDTELTAFLGQYYTFSKIANDFRNNGFKFKQMLKDLIMSPYFRSINAAENIDETQLEHLSAVGTGHLLTPEQLNRKIENVTGIQWQPNEFDTPNLLEDGGGQGYRILYGGIDSRDTTNRITSPSGIMANVAERMGLEVGCKLSNSEFSIPIEQRRFLKNAELSDEPQDANFRDVPDSIAKIKADIQYLHQKLLGEKLEVTDPEIERTYQLFVDVWRNGKENVVSIDTSFPDGCVADRNYVTGESFDNGDMDMRLHDDALYTGRAWQAVIAYLLTDYDFLFE